MTTPVFMETQSSSSERETERETMSFVMPSDYWTPESLRVAPRPLEGSLVELKSGGGDVRAVAAFGGLVSKKEVQARKDALRKALERYGEDWEMDGEQEDEAWSVAQYNDPFTAPWKRRNEILLRIVNKQEK
mmetsp:Transcript_23825/g.29026  ORF Transcript_23825/g.29026 Transcript_23825/m.29026 type:complete len:132 (-) Transcript_23825:18-413(-)